MISALDIVNKAIACGFDKCGIIPVEKMAKYEQRLDERMTRFSDTRTKYENFRHFANPQNEFPWAKSIVICTYWYGKYMIQENLQGKIGKHYLADERKNPNAPQYTTSHDFEKYMNEQGLRTACKRDFGITALRWAAKEAGIGIIRKNNYYKKEYGAVIQAACNDEKEPVREMAKWVLTQLER